MNKHFVFALLLLSFVFPLSAQREDRPPNQVLIVSAEVDPVMNRLILAGENFDSPTAPVVRLNNMPLELIVATNVSMVVQLPAQTLAPGTYLLTVSKGKAATDFDAFAVTLGAVGPRGPSGPRGARGTAGEDDFQLARHRVSPYLIATGKDSQGRADDGPRRHGARHAFGVRDRPRRLPARRRDLRTAPRCGSPEIVRPRVLPWIGGIVHW